MLKYDGLPIPDYKSFYELFLSRYCDSPKSLGIFYDAYEQDKKKEHAWSIKFDDFAIKLFADTRVRAEYLAKMEHKKFCESKGADENRSIIKSIKECDDIGYGQKSTEAKTEQTQSIWVLAINSEMTAESTTLLFSTEAAARERLLDFYDDEFEYLDWENNSNPTRADLENKKRNSFTALHNYDNNTYVDYVVYKQEIDSNGD